MGLLLMRLPSSLLSSARSSTLSAPSLSSASRCYYCCCRLQGKTTTTPAQQLLRRRHHPLSPLSSSSSRLYSSSRGLATKTLQWNFPKIRNGTIGCGGGIRHTNSRLASSSSPPTSRHRRRLTSSPSSSSSSSSSSGSKGSTTTTTTTTTDSTTSSSSGMVALRSFGIGSLAGSLGSLAGMGGGFVMIPLMTRFVGLTQHQAHGTSLFAVAVTGMVGALSYNTSSNLNSSNNNNKSAVHDDESSISSSSDVGAVAAEENNNNNNSCEGGVVQWDVAAMVAVAGMISARFGAKTSSHLSQKTLQKVLGLLMLSMAPAVPAKAYLMEYNQQQQKHQQQQTDDKIRTRNSNDDLVRQWVAPGCIGLGSGFLAGLFGVGGGVVVVPALSFATNMNHHQALATSLAAMVLPAVSGVLTHSKLGHVSMMVAPGLSLGAALGAYGGGKLGAYVPEDAMRWGFGAVLAILGIRALR